MAKRHNYRRSIGVSLSFHKRLYMKIRPWFLLLPLLLAYIPACQKSASGGGTSAKTKTELISKSTWRFDHAGLDLDNNGTIDSPLPAGVLENCDTDGTLTFNSNGTGVGDEGATKCDAADPQTANFNWSFKNGETVISITNITFGGLSGDFKLVSLTESEFTLEKTVSSMGLTVNVVVVLKH